VVVKQLRPSVDVFIAVKTESVPSRVVDVVDVVEVAENK